MAKRRVIDPAELDPPGAEPARRRTVDPADLDPAPVPMAPVEPAPPPGPFGGGEFGGQGASGGWGYPDPGLLSAMATKWNQGVTKGGSDEGVGLLGRAVFGEDSAPGRYLRLPDGSELPAFTPADLQAAAREFERQNQVAAEQHYPKLGFAAEMGGDIASDYALAGGKALKRSYQTLAGLTRGLLHSDAELIPERATPWSVGDAALSSMLGGAIGNLTPVAMTKAAESGVGKYLGQKADDLFTGAGNKLQNAAGWLKVNSIHPTPTNAEAMASLPGGVPAVGRELLKRGVGGPTKATTARQASQAAKEASGAITRVVREYDTAGGAPIDIGHAIDVAKLKAKELFDEPTTKAAGEKLLKLVEEYEATLGPGRLTSGTQALAMKRALGKAAYGAKQELKKSGSNIAGDFGEGLSVFERSVDDAMDQAIGPGFGEANLVFRRLLGAKNAAQRTAARQDTNLLALGLQNLGGGTLGATLGGGPGAVLGLGGTWLARKYGAQLGARSLYGLGGALQSTPRLIQMMEGPAAGTASRTSLADLLELVRQPDPPPLPAFAEGRER